MLLTRAYDFEHDAKWVNEIWNKYYSNEFGLPSLDNTIIKRVVEVDDKPVAYGFAKIFAEATLVLDQSNPRTLKVQALQALMLDAIRGCKQHKISQLHATIKDRPEYVKLLKKHYGFKDVNGTMLVMEID